MNERIKELAEQAGMLAFHPVMDFDKNEISWQGWSTDLEKFAELIVKECVTKCEVVANMAAITNSGEMARKTKATADSCASMIKEHFRVE